MSKTIRPRPPAWPEQHRLTAGDIFAILSFAGTRGGEAARTARFHDESGDGFVLAAPEAGDDLRIARDIDGSYWASAANGRRLAAGASIDDVLTPLRRRLG